MAFRDALEVVANLKDMLEDSRFTQSRYRAQSDAKAVKVAHSELTTIAALF